MLMKFVLIITLALLAQACAHKEAVKVDCNGPLRPINQPTSHQQPPVSVEPAKNDSPDPAQRRP